jgi:hypothetical protein
MITYPKTYFGGFNSDSLDVSELRCAVLRESAGEICKGQSKFNKRDSLKAKREVGVEEVGPVFVQGLYQCLSNVLFFPD